MILASVIVFFALTFCLYLLYRTCSYYLIEKNRQNKFASYMSLARFIQPEKLLNLQIISAVFLSSATLLIFIACGLCKWYALVPAAIIPGILGYWGPYWYYCRKNVQRQQLIEAKLLDFTMALASSMKAGQGLPQALETVTRRSSGPIQEEFQQLLREYKLGLDLSEVFERLAERVPCEDMRLLVTSIKLTAKSGGSLVEVLQEMTQMIRQRTEFQEKLKTMTAQGRFEAIAISFSPLLAFCILWFIDRELMVPLLTTTTGWCAIGIIGILIAIGFFIINKIVTIEV